MFSISFADVFLKFMLEKGSMWLIPYIAIRNVFSFMVFPIGFEVLNNILTYC